MPFLPFVTESSPFTINGIIYEQFEHIVQFSWITAFLET